MMKKIPLVLIYTRLLAGFAIVALSIAGIAHYRLIAITLLTIGLLTDIFDGIIARRLNISSTKLRRMDSTVDQVFFISYVLATYIQCPDFFSSNKVLLMILLGAEALIYIVSFLKFRKEVATHSIGAKIWTLVLFAALVELTIHCQSLVLFQICFWLGMLTRMEIIAITLAVKKWTSDVPSIYHALQLRKGKEIKRNKMFNG